MAEMLQRRPGRQGHRHRGPEAARQSYALRGCHGALLAASEPALASCSQVAGGGDRWLLMAVRGHLGGTCPKCVGRVLGGVPPPGDLPVFRYGMSQVGAGRVSVLRCRRPYR